MYLPCNINERKIGANEMLRMNKMLKESRFGHLSTPVWNDVWIGLK
jgi:hypothetical protein